MSLSDVFSTVMRIRRIVGIVSLVAASGAGYKYGPTVYQRIESHGGGKPSMVAQRPADGSTTTNAAGLKLCNRDLGELSLTNRFETRVALGNGRECLLTPEMVDRHTVQLTVTLRSKASNGLLHELAITQVVTPTGKPFDVMVGDFDFSLTPKVTSQ